MEAGESAVPPVGLLVQVRPAGGPADHAEAAGPFDGFGAAGCSGGVEEHAGIFGGTVGAVGEGDDARWEGGMLDVRYFGGVGWEGGIGGVVVAEDGGVTGFGGVVLQGGGDGGEELVGRDDEVCVGYGEAVFKWVGCEGGVDGCWDGSYFPEGEDCDDKFGGVVDYHCYQVPALDIQFFELALHFRDVRH